ncbi:uncharacterized protein LOC115763387 [Drosophila novamexicana]|uniref:uncharacterized protein LOC115763387 n=1 Tax=Drosophila novamexicana TaxID=47314 RepID=UPI0011E58903|nr:uncharacterized protein LOC115763387 [Drosophila novamexicana]
MAANTPVAEAENGEKAQISTFAVLDLETSNLPAYNNNRVSITELCIYAFDPAVLKDSVEPEDQLTPPSPNALPLPPRVLHKLNLLFQPSMTVHPGAERITGLNNYILERESKLDENAGQIILRFLEHLRPPVCLVAHNGWAFDFPIIKQALDKLNINLPASTLCVDSLRAFMEIDDKRSDEIVVENVLATDIKLEPETTCEPPAKVIDWQKVNETTPKRPILRGAAATRKRQLLNDDTCNNDVEAAKRAPRDISARRQLFAGLKCAQTERIPPRGCYGLARLFERTFEKSAANAHQAEADVIMLTKLIQCYSVDFLAFAEEQAIPFANVVPIGGKAPSS